MPANKSQSLAAPPIPTMPDPGEKFSDVTARSTNALHRTFMQRLTGALQQLFGPNGGQFVDNPNALLFNTAEQTFAATNTAYPVVYNTTYLSNSVALKSGSTSQIQVAVGGIYNFQYTGQVISENSSAKTIYLWINRNGTNIGYSTRANTLSANGEYLQIDWNFQIDLQVNDYIELMVSVSDTGMHIHAESSTSPHTGIPSSVMTVNYVAPLPETIPTPP